MEDAPDRALCSTSSPGRWSAELWRFYAARACAPAWTGDGGIAGDARELLEALEATPEQGLPIERYLTPWIERTLAGETPQAAGERLALERELTVAFLQLSADLAHGVLAPEVNAWPTRPERIDPVERLETALGGLGVRRTLSALEPAQPGYLRLKAALARYRAIEAAGGWPTVPGGPALFVGQTGPRVVALRRRLQATGDLPPGPARADVFDAALSVGVERFQERHGLPRTAEVDERTLHALNVQVHTRIWQLCLNLERWRWQPRQTAERYLEVNLAAYELQAVEGGDVVAKMRVVAGAQEHPTPLLVDRIDAVTTYPVWDVPRSLAEEELLPMMLRDPAASEAAGFSTYDAGGSRVDPRSVDWTHYVGRPIPFRFVQAPAPTNPMGRIKFSLRNKHRVLLHGTPRADLFDEVWRAYSYGCIRLQDAEELARFAVGSEGAAAQLHLALQDQRQVRLPIEPPLPVSLLYWTAFVDEGEQTVGFRYDVYGLDRVLAEALLLARAPES